MMTRFDQLILLLCLLCTLLAPYPLQATQQLELGGQYDQLLGADGHAGFGWILGYGLGGKLSPIQRLYGLVQVQQLMGLTQEGDLRLGKPSLERNRWSLGVEMRSYRLLWQKLHLLLGIKFAYLLDFSELKFQALPMIQRDTQGIEIGFNLGLLYRLSDMIGIQAYWSPSYLIDREGLQLAEKDIGIDEEKRHNGLNRYFLSAVLYF